MVAEELQTAATRLEESNSITSASAIARTQAIAVIFFAELLRSFGARSETKPMWRIALVSNINLAIVVCVVLFLQVWSHHNTAPGSILKTSFISFAD